MNIDVKTALSITDELTINSMMDEGIGDFTSGLSLIVESVVEINSFDGTVNTKIFTFEEDINIYLMKREVGKKVIWKVLFKVPEFEEAVRGNIVDDGITFMFNEPEGEVAPNELEYAREIEPDGEVFEQCLNSFGGLEERPFVEGVSYPVFSELAEYKTEQAENPDLIFLESGGMDEDDEPLPQGGWMEIYRGREINEIEIEVL